MSDTPPRDTPDAAWLDVWAFVNPAAPGEVDDVADADRLVAAALADHPDLVDDLDPEDRP